MATDQTIFNATVPLTDVSDIIIWMAGKQYYSSVSGSIPWIIRVYLDGTQIDYATGCGAYTDTPNIHCSVKALPAGNHTVLITWRANTNIKIYNLNCTILTTRRGS